jgi:protein phosphatase
VTTLRAGAATDVGRVRQINEDRYLCDDDAGLYAVADGVGGHQAGEVAAQTAVETLQEAFTDHTIEGLSSAVQMASQAVWRLAQTASEKRGMGTTLTAIGLVLEDGEEQLGLANVGDSRAYLLQHGQLEQLTEDHSLVEEMVREGKLTRAEAAVHPQRSIITRALGMEPEIEVDAWQLIPYRGDRLLLCSDGLTNELSDERIAATLRQLADPTDAARDLVRQARAEGGGDNITVVVVDVLDDDDRAERASAALAVDGPAPARPVVPPRGSGDLGFGDDLGEERPRLSRGAVSTAAPPSDLTTSLTLPKPVRPRRFTWRTVAFLVLLAAIVGGTVLAIGWYARGAYFVKFDGNQVAIYKGRPGGILWFEPTLAERKTSPTRDQILPMHYADLERGKEVASKKEADRYVTRIRQQAEAARPSTTTSVSTSTTALAAVPPPPP